MKKYEDWLRNDPDLQLRMDSEEWFKDGKYINGLREHPKSNEIEQDFHLSSCLKRIFPNHNFIHNKVLKINNKVILDRSGRRIQPDFICEDLNLIVEFDGESWHGGGHYTDPEVCFRDEDRNVILGHLGYKVIRIPFYIQLDKEMIKHYFNVAVDTPLYHMSFDHGFMMPGMKLPNYFCELCLIRFLNELRTLPDNVLYRVLWTWSYRAMYESEMNFEFYNQFPLDLNTCERNIPEHYKYESTLSYVRKLFPDYILSEIKELIIQRNLEEMDDETLFGLIFTSLGN